MYSAKFNENQTPPLHLSLNKSVTSMASEEGQKKKSRAEKYVAEFFVEQKNM